MMVSLPILNSSSHAIPVVANTVPWYGPMIIPALIIIFGGLGFLALLKFLSRRPKTHKIKPLGKIMAEKQTEDTRHGGKIPKNAVLEINSKDRIKILWYNDTMLIPSSTNPKKKATPIECYYIRGRQINRFSQRHFKRLVPIENFYISKKKLKEINDPKDGTLIALVARRTLYFSVEGNTHFDAEFGDQIEQKVEEKTYWKSRFETNLEKGADTAKKEVVTGSPGLAGSLEAIRESGEAQVKIEKTKRGMYER